MVIRPRTVDLTEEMVISALESIQKGTLSTVNDEVLDLRSIDVVLEGAYANVAAYRQLALAQVISSLVLDVINSAILQHTNISISENTERSSIISVLCHLPKPASKLSLGALWVYVHYCRFDLEIHRAEFCEYAVIDKRTLQRYQAYAIRRLWGLLLQSEVHAKKKLAKLTLPRLRD